MKPTLLALGALFLLALPFQARAASFDPSACPKKVALVYTKIAGATDGLKQRMQDNALTVRFNLYDKDTLMREKVCLYGGRDSGKAPEGYTMYIATMAQPSAGSNETALSFWSQQGLFSKEVFEGVMELPTEAVVLAGPQSLALKNPQAERTLQSRYDYPQPDAGTVPPLYKSIGTAQVVELTVE